MKLRRLSLVLLASVMPLLIGERVLAAVGAPSHVKASLVAADASIQPGKPLTVALRFVHDSHWHTYWVNPGTGLATSMSWKLPAGWTAGPIQWPAPQILKDSKGNIVGNGYEGELFLPMTLTPPADLKPGDKVELKGTADWLMCQDVCIPGNATLALTLPVATEPAKADPTWGEKIRATLAGLPRSDPAWKIAATRDGKTITLTLTPATKSDAAPKDPHFFSEDGLIGFDLPQGVKSDGRGGVVLTLPVAPDGPQNAKKLVGVVTSENGWMPGQTLRGLTVVAELGGNSEPVSNSSAPVATASTGGATATAAGAGGGASLTVTLLIALVGGLILNLMPCVFPVIGIKILGFVNQAGHERTKVVAHGLTFAGGVLLSFWILAALLSILGGGRGWGYQLQIPGFNFAIAIVMLVFAMSLSGVFEFGLSATTVGGSLQMKSGYAGSFFTGVLATVVATPCSAPFLATALGATITLPAVQKFAVFTAIGLGLAAPYLLLSIFPAAVKILPRPGAWMETFKQFMAFPLYGTVAYLVWVLAAQTSDEGFRGALFGLVLVAMGVWFYGRWHAPGASAGRARFGLAGLLVCGALGAWIGWPHRMEAAEQRDASAASEVVWEPWSPEAVAKLRGEGRVIYVDFTARWCATCQTNKKLVFHSDEVLRYFAEHKIVTLRGDWTNQDARITAELARYQRAAVPFNVIWAPGHEEPIILPEILTPGIVLDALKKNQVAAVAR